MPKRADKRGQGPKQSPLPDAKQEPVEPSRASRLAAIDRLRGRIGRLHR